jgi:hypothetical protein
MLKSQVFAIKNKTSVMKRHSINVFRKLRHHTEYHKSVINGQLTCSEDEALRPLNVMIIAYPNADDGVIPVRLNPVHRPIFDKPEQAEEEKLSDKRKSASVYGDDVLGLYPEGHQMKSDLKIANIELAYEEEALDEMRQWIVANPGGNEVETGGWSRNLSDQCDKVDELRRNVEGVQLRIAVYRQEQLNLWADATKVPSTGPAAQVPAYLRLSTPYMDEGEPDFERQRDLVPELVKDHSFHNLNAKAKGKKPMADLATSVATYADVVRQGFDMDITTRFWFTNIRKSVGMPFN